MLFPPYTYTYTCTCLVVRAMCTTPGQDLHLYVALGMSSLHGETKQVIMYVRMVVGWIHIFILPDKSLIIVALAKWPSSPSVQCESELSSKACRRFLS